MNARSFAALLGPAAWAVLVGGWVLAIGTFLAIGTESCTRVAVPVAGTIEVCQDTTAGAVIMLTVIGFVATVGSLFLFDTAETAGVDLLFEASVAGGIPLMRPLRESLAGERITRVMGIVNGTTNYVSHDELAARTLRAMQSRASRSSRRGRARHRLRRRIQRGAALRTLNRGPLTAYPARAS